jgi:hypothetical protein
LNVNAHLLFKHCACFHVLFHDGHGL